MSVRVLGIGSPFGADRAGWQVVEHLKTLLDETDDTSPGAVQLICADRPGPELVSLIRNQQHLVLVDALVDAGPPGTQHLLQPRDLIAQRNTLSTHEIGVAEVLALAEALGELPERMVIFGLVVDPAAEPSASHIEALAHRIHDYLNKHKKRAAERREEGRLRNSEGAIPR